MKEVKSQYLLFTDPRKGGGGCAMSRGREGSPLFQVMSEQERKNRTASKHLFQGVGVKLTNFSQDQL